MSTHVLSLMYLRFDANQLVLNVEKPNTEKCKTTGLLHFTSTKYSFEKICINDVTNKISWYIN